MSNSPVLCFASPDGGVGRNIAEVLGRLGSKPFFYTAIGGKSDGLGIISRLRNECGVMTSSKSVHVAADLNTAQYLALLDSNSDLVGGVADMEALSRIPIPAVEDLSGVELLVLDSNAPVETLTMAAKNGVKAGCLVCFDPTSVPKARLVSRSIDFVECLTFVFPNKDELLAMAEELNDGIESSHGIINASDEYKPLRDAAAMLLSRMKSDKAHIVITLGKAGVLLASKTDNVSKPPKFDRFPAEFVSNIKSSNGAGDTLCGAFVHAILQGATVEEAVHFGMKASLFSLDCADHAISPILSTLQFKFRL
jgi:sugar/nucleoside kinase (ribokinase family)